MRLNVPDPSLVVLVGASGSGKSTLASREFAVPEIVSSDACRAWVSNDARAQSASGDAFDVLHLIVERRLSRNLLTVVDATNVEDHAREALLGLARRHHVQPMAIVLDIAEEDCLRHDAARTDRHVPPDVIARQRSDLQRSLGLLEDEGFARVHVLRTPAEVAEAVVVREPLACDRRAERGPFDIVGDVHGCFDELADLLGRLGWRGLPRAGESPSVAPTHPEGRTLILLGDLTDRGPRIPDVLELAMLGRDAGTVRWLMGNHEAKLLRKLQGRDVKISHGLEQTLEQVGAMPPAFVQRLTTHLESLDDHLVLDDGRLVVAHAGMKEPLQGRWGKAVRAFALFGETTGETDEYGLPIRYPWAKDYRGQAAVVYGHTPIPATEWINNTICLDTGCVFGGKMTALRWPERTIVEVRAHRAWYVPSRPFPGA